MSTPDESKILKILEDEDGESSVGRIARKLRLTPNYTRVILRSMGESDIIDVFRTGKVKIANKGWGALGKQVKQTSNGLKRYMEDRAKWEAI